MPTDCLIRCVSTLAHADGTEIVTFEAKSMHTVTSTNLGGHRPAYMTSENLKLRLHITPEA